MSNNSHQGEGFFYQPKTIQWILRIFYFLSIVLVIADFFVHRHIITEIEKIPAFYAIYGFIACVVLVLIASQMRRLVMRKENYYEKDEGEEESKIKEEGKGGLHD